MLEPLLQGFNEPEEGKTTENASGANSTADKSSPKRTTPLPEGPEDEEEAESGSIGDDIAALEAELEKEGLLEADEDQQGTLSTHLQGGGEEAVRKAAWCLFEVLLPRCVGLEGQGLETRLEGPTSFSHRFGSTGIVGHLCHKLPTRCTVPVCPRCGCVALQ